MGSNEAEQRVLALLSFGADFREPGRDDANGPDSGVEDRFHRLEHHRRRDTDDGEIDRIGNVGDGAVATYPCDGLAVAVDGVRRARELAVQDVAKELPADRAAAGRGAEDGDRLRLEERAQRRDHGRVVACLDARGVVGRRGNGKRQLHLAAREKPRNLEAGAFEDVDHRRVVRHDLGDEALDPLAGRPSRELLEKPRADAASLVVVGDREGHLRAQRIPKAHVVRESDDPAFTGLDHRASESSPVDPVRIENGVDEPLVDGRAAVEA